MTGKIQILILAACIVVSINGQSTAENEVDIAQDNNEQSQKPENGIVEETQKPESSENPPEVNPVDTNADTKSDPSNTNTEKPSESASDVSPVTESQPVVTENVGNTQMFVLVPVPPNPFPNYVPMYPGLPQPMQPPFMFNQPPMPFMPMPQPMRFPPPPPPPPSFMINPAGNAPGIAPNGQATVIVPPMFYPQQHPAGTPQVVVLNQQKNPSDVVVGQSAVYFNKPDKNQEVIIIKSR